MGEREREKECAQKSKPPYLISCWQAKLTIREERGEKRKRKTFVHDHFSANMQAQPIALCLESEEYISSRAMFIVARCCSSVYPHRLFTFQAFVGHSLTITDVSLTGLQSPNQSCINYY